MDLSGLKRLSLAVLVASAASARAELSALLKALPKCATELGQLADPDGLQIVHRIGLLGKQRNEAHAALDAKYGAGNWEIRHSYQGKLLTKAEALALYEDSYVAYFQANPKVLDDLVHRARDVYDTNVSNVQSGLDYDKQETASTHLQDIAVRRALQRLGRRFEGTELLQMRGPSTPLYALTPGFIPFVDAPAILSQPRIYTADWIHPNSVEDFWQNNKFVVVKPRPTP